MRQAVKRYHRRRIADGGISNQPWLPHRMQWDAAYPGVVQIRYPEKGGVAAKLVHAIGKGQKWKVRPRRGKHQSAGSVDFLVFR